MINLKKIPFIIFFTFLITFFVARLIVYAIHYDLVPNALFFVKWIYIKNYHIHHYVFGVILLIITGFLSLFDHFRHQVRKMAVFYGIGLGLIMDEFGMLITLDDVYWTNRLSYDAVMFVSLVLLNVCFFGKFWRGMGSRVLRLFSTHRRRPSS